MSARLARRGGFAAGAAALALAGCLGLQEPDTGVGGGPAAVGRIVSGNLQTAAAGRALGDPIRVRLTDSAGRPADGIQVTFHVRQGGGRVTPGTVVTDANGVAEGRWTLGPTPGPQAVEAVWFGTQSVFFSATAEARP